MDGHKIMEINRISEIIEMNFGSNISILEINEEITNNNSILQK